MFCHLEFGGTKIRRGKNKRLYLFGSCHYRCYFRNCVKRKNYLDVGSGHDIGLERIAYIGKENQELFKTLICYFYKKSQNSV